MAFLSVMMRLGAAAFGMLRLSHCDRLQKEKNPRPLNWKSGPILQGQVTQSPRCSPQRKVVQIGSGCPHVRFEVLSFDWRWGW